MYHPGMVLKVFRDKSEDVVSSDSSVQVMLEMWDENLVTVLVHKKLAKELKENDVVLVDYRPYSDKLPFPKMMASKILRGATADETWKKYKQKHEQLKKQQVISPQHIRSSTAGYIG